MAGSVAYPRYVDLDTSGNGTVAHRAQTPTMKSFTRKITVEAPVTSSGTVSIYKGGELVTSKALALMMSAEGSLELGAGQEVTVRFAGGPASTRIKVTFHVEEIPI